MTFGAVEAHTRHRVASQRLVAAAVIIVAVACAAPAVAQQRPLLTEDPEPIGAGRILIEAGFEAADNQKYPASGLEGNLVRFPTLGLSFGLSSIAELQIDGGFYNHLSIETRRKAPLSGLLDVTGDSTHDVEDTVVATKIRVLSETDGRPAFALRFATKLPNASNESGLGLDTIDFTASLLGAKTVRSIRLVGNIGIAILSDPTDGSRQNDNLAYGASLARAVTTRTEIVGEVNGRASSKSKAYPGTESRGLLRFGGRYTSNAFRVDGGLYFGLTSHDPTVGLTLGFTYVLNAFKVP